MPRRMRAGDAQSPNDRGRGRKPVESACRPQPARTAHGRLPAKTARGLRRQPGATRDGRAGDAGRDREARTMRPQQGGVRMTMRAAVAAALCGSVCCAPQAIAQGAAAYPVKPVRFINPLAAGGNQDIVSRAIAEQLSKGLGHQVIVENRPGASAIVGTRLVKSAAPDGYTLLTISNTFA